MDSHEETPEELESVPQEEFIEVDEVAQEVGDDAEDKMMDIDDEDGEETIEIDMSNNSWSYFDEHSDSVFTVSHHPSLPLAVTGGGDNRARLWTSHHKEVKVVSTVEHSESVIQAAFTASGKYLVTMDMNGQVLVHKSMKGGAKWKKIAELQEVDEIVWGEVHPRKDGYFAFGAVDGSVWCYQIDEASDTLVHLMSGYMHSQDCTMGRFIDEKSQEDMLTLVTCSLDSTIVGWNCFTGQSVFKVTSSELKGLETPWITLSYAPAELTKGTPIVACGSDNGVLVIINGQTGAVLHMSAVVEVKEGEEKMDASIESITWSAKRSLMALGLVSGEILLYDTQTWRTRHKFVLPDSVTKLKFDDATGNFLFASCIVGKVYQFDARSGQEVHVFVGHNLGVLDFVLVEDKKRLITAGDEGVSLIFEYQ
ncbi:HDL072Cp [Eremothecium sinecaudum]|uniref:HDL072Cp n=1 Tax=Eremothecium sinecaudum TaxID=45286 RepID=A0A109UZ20_9SACH|nr:HDL072Cp [Eremothecium sinecaudum]AMD20672.1 HDL072Cp [Eremothecium sinecaudum]